MRRTLLTLLAFACSAVLARDPIGVRGVDAARNGAIRGRVDLRKTPAPSEPRPNVADLGAAAATLDISDRLRSVVYLESAPRGAFEIVETTHAVMDQRGERFVPHILAITTGTTVDFPNSDHIYHNVFSLSKTKRFDLGRYAAGHSQPVFAAGVSILKRERPDLMYLSTTDYVQHKAAPGSELANSFYAMMDRYVGELDAAGCVLAMSADHGMNDKHLPNGEPDVIYLQTLFDEWLGAGEARVILPITDPYVAHHGALGSFATVYLPAGADIDAILGRLRPVEGVDVALNRDEACARFELPADRIGDIVVVSTIHKVLGTARERPG